MTETSNVVYVGIPLAKDGILADGTAVSASSAEKSSYESSGWGGFVAFLLAAFLAALGWVANQGWTIVSVLAFGELKIYAVRSSRLLPMIPANSSPALFVR